MSKTELLTELTEPHKKVLRYLQARGLEAQWEEPFPPYQVDIYLPRYHAAVEVDGPQHVAEKDRERDEELYAEYALPVYHIPTGEAAHPERWWSGVAAFLNDALPSRRMRQARQEAMSEWE